MLYHAQLLAGKLRRILLFANENPDLKNVKALSGKISEGEYKEFSYERRSNGETSTHYSKPKTIGRYIRFLEEINLLNEDMTLQLNVEDIQSAADLLEVFSDMAHEKLEERGFDILEVSRVSVEILSNGEPTLPTIEAIFEAFGIQGGLRNFRWLIYLYLLSDVALIQYWQKPLIVPNNYN